MSESVLTNAHIEQLITKMDVWADRYYSNHTLYALEGMALSRSRIANDYYWHEFQDEGGVLVLKWTWKSDGSNGVYRTTETWQWKRNVSRCVIALINAHERGEPHHEA